MPLPSPSRRRSRRRENPETSVPIAYPLVGLGLQAPDIHVIASEDEFTTTSMDTSFYPADGHYFDSAGGVYSVLQVIKMDKPPFWLTDMGRTRYRIFVKLKREKTIDLKQAREMVLEILKNPRSSWAYSPESLQHSVAAVGGFRTLAELAEGCKESWKWSRRRRVVGRPESMPIGTDEEKLSGVLRSAGKRTRRHKC